MSPRFVRHCVDAARAGASNLATDALLGFADLPDDAMPSLLTQVGGTECFVDDAERLHRRLGSAGVAHRLRVVPGQVHSFVVLAPWVPEARAAVVEAARFLA